MRYFFPGVISLDDVNKTPASETLMHVDSGTNAIRLALKYLKLNKGDKIAIPAFVCPLVEYAVVLENLIPVKLDIKKDHTYWTDYDSQYIQSKSVKAIILVHLYGFLHPDTERIVAEARKSNIPVIHDLAQCYGVSTDLFSKELIVYSYGAGKASVAGMGGSVENIPSDFYNKNVEFIPANSLRGYLIKERIKAFIRSRTYGYEGNVMRNKTADIINKLYLLFFQNTMIYSMVPYQLQAAGWIMKNLEKVNELRKERYLIVKKALLVHSFLSIAYDNDRGQYFKAIIYCNKSPEHFKKYLTENDVPFFNLFIHTEGTKAGNLVNFSQTAQSFFEFSTEASLPVKEIERVAAILAAYNSNG